MTHNIIISKSTKKDKTYMANIDNTKNIHFGQSGASDMTMHNDSDRKQKIGEKQDIKPLAFWLSIFYGIKKR